MMEIKKYEYVFKKAKPMLFKQHLLELIDKTQKTVTRRVINPQPTALSKQLLGIITDSTDEKTIGCFGWGLDEYSGIIHTAKPRYKSGDIVYVPEGWKVEKVNFSKKTMIVRYKRDNALSPEIQFTEERFLKFEKFSKKKVWQSPYFLPKEAARVFLRITNCKAERIQDITIPQMRAEGFPLQCSNCYHHNGNCEDFQKSNTCILQNAFVKTFNGTVKKIELPHKGYNANPWVWVYEFEKLQNVFISNHYKEKLLLQN